MSAGENTAAVSRAPRDTSHVRQVPQRTHHMSDRSHSEHITCQTAPDGHTKCKCGPGNIPNVSQDLSKNIADVCQGPWETLNVRRAGTGTYRSWPGDKTDRHAPGKTRSQAGNSLRRTHGRAHSDQRRGGGGLRTSRASDGGGKRSIRAGRCPGMGHRLPGLATRHRCRRDLPLPTAPRHQRQWPTAAAAPP